MSNDLRSFFLLRPDVAFLNHGSFGACPRPVFEENIRWQRELEDEPVEFFARRLPQLLRDAMGELARFIGCDPLDVVHVTNATIGVNIVARSLRLGPGDEVLATDHEYGACSRTWRFLAGKNGFTYRAAHVPIPVTTHAEFLENFFAQVTPATRVIFISHITSPTALTIPVRQICEFARERGIITLIDGAHGPGQIPLNLEALGADFYTGNLHKWLCSPKGSAFLHARREMQPLLEPLVVSWGWEAVIPGSSTFVDHHEMWGTRDLSPALSVPAAIRFQQEHEWDGVRARCHELVREAREALSMEFGFVPVAPDDDAWFAQMSSFLIPDGIDAAALQERLFNEHLVEIPVFPWFNGRSLVRISVQGYNTAADVERLCTGIRAITSRSTG
ncbi:MAG TPA: aminotransferase class V-fold PLP-dependent enzyme [Candidatus Kapabacteria bacterium]|nr:aminotransferase class V-fold PLP-dependent enzyme [Candidatus Kapabacteria bacterium]